MIDFLCAGVGDLRVSMTLRRSLIVISWVSLKSCVLCAGQGRDCTYIQIQKASQNTANKCNAMQIVLEREHHNENNVKSQFICLICSSINKWIIVIDHQCESSIQVQAMGRCWLFLEQMAGDGMNNSPELEVVGAIRYTRIEGL